MEGHKCDKCHAKITFGTAKLFTLTEAKLSSGKMYRYWCRVRCQVCGYYNERIAELTGEL